MKKRICNILIFATLFVIIAAPSISFDALYPAQINVPAHIKTIAIVDYSQIESKLLNVIEGGLTGEGIGQDKMASQICIDGLFNKLNNNNRFTVIRTSEAYKSVTNGIGFPMALSWTKIDSICMAYNADAVIALEIFDSNFASNAVEIKSGFRLYDPSTKSITDQYRFVHHAGWHEPPHSVAGAVTRLMEKDRTLKEVSYEAGVIYGERISPSWFRVERKYYNRPKRDDNLSMGARFMEVNDWENAITALEKAVESGKRKKIRGRAAHNLAVVHEILGDYHMAKKWARDAWAKYENKASKDYLYIINQRLNDIKQLDAGTKD